MSRPPAQPDLCLRPFSRASDHVREYAAMGVTAAMVRRWLLSRGIDAPKGALPRSAYEGYLKAHPALPR